MSFFSSHASSILDHSYDLFDKQSNTYPAIKKKILFIINPYSGTGRHRAIEDRIDKYLNRDIYEYMISYTKGPKHATTLAENAAKEGIEVVVAVGGDGSVNEVAQGLIGTKTALGIIPVGSGNGLARYLRIPMLRKRAIDCLNTQYVRAIDTVQMNEENFIGVAGIGFDAKVSIEFSNFGKRGLLSYLKIIAQQLPHYKPKDYQLIIDGRVYQEKAFLICFANSGQYGNNVYIAPGAEIDDGVLDLLIFKDFPPHATPKLLLDLINKRLEHSKYIDVIQCKEVVMQRPLSHLHIDGEPVVMKGDISFKVLPQSLNVLCYPPNSF